MQAVASRQPRRNAAEPAWTLRPVSPSDESALHALLSQPEVYRFLCDGEPPPREATARWIATALEGGDAALGLWLLRDGDDRLAGCARLSAVREEPTWAELTYALHPGCWGLGLATGMSWRVCERAFGTGRVASILAGADAPNTASFEVMKRLGMRFLRHTRYPLGPGYEYVLHRGDAEPPARVRAISLLVSD